jgi:hypothetical protein
MRLVISAMKGDVHLHYVGICSWPLVYDVTTSVSCTMMYKKYDSGDNDHIPVHILLVRVHKLMICLHVKSATQVSVKHFSSDL